MAAPTGNPLRQPGTEYIVPAVVLSHVSQARTALASAEHHLRRGASGAEHDRLHDGAELDIRTAVYEAEHAVERLANVIAAKVRR